MKKSYLLLLFCLVSFAGVAQIPIAYYSCESPTHTYTTAPGCDLSANTLPTGSALTVGGGMSQNATGATSAGNGVAHGGSAGFDYAFNSGGTKWSTVTTDPTTAATSYFQFEVNTAGFSGITLTFDVLISNGNAPQKYGVLASSDGTTWNFIGSSTTTGTGNTVTALSTGSFVSPSFNLTSNYSSSDNNSTLYIRIYGYSGAAGAGSGAYMGVDNITVLASSTVAGANVTTINEATYYSDYTSGSTGQLSRNGFTAAGAGTNVTINNSSATSGVSIASAKTFSVTTGATVTLGNTGKISGAGIFNLAPGTTLATSNSGGVLGSITTSGANVLSAGANYTFNATTATAFPSSGFNFTTTSAPGTITINASGGTVTANVAVTPSVAVNLYDGTFSNGSNLTMANGSTVNRDNGTFSAVPTWGSGGTGVINVAYTTGGPGTLAVVSGLELPTGGTNLGSLTVNKPGATITLSVTPTVNGSLGLTSGTLADGGNLITLKGNITGSGTESGTGGITMTTASSTISGATINRLTLNNASGFSLTASPVITGTLTLTSGVLTTGSFNITVPGVSSAVARTGSTTSNYVKGNLLKTIASPATATINYEVGDNDYAPAQLVLNTAGSAGKIGVSSTNGNHPQIASSGVVSTANAGHYWTVTSVGATGFASVTPTFTYQSTYVTGGAGNTGFVTQVYANSVGPWSSTIPSTDGGSTTYTTAANSSIASYTGDYIVGKANPVAPVLTAASSATVDAPFVITFPDDPTWRGAFSSITVGGTALTAGYAFGVGTLTLTPSASVPAGLLQTAGTKTIAVLASGYAGTSVSQTINPGNGTHLVVITQPTAPATNGGALATQPVVSIEDQYNNITTSTAAITATASGSAWTLTPSSETSPGVNAISGTSTFTISAAASGFTTASTITFGSVGVSSVTSSSFGIPNNPGSPITYYSKSTGNLDVLSTWGTNTDGSGLAPVNFNTTNQTFIIQNNLTPTIAGTWSVTATGSSVTVGDGSAAVNFTIPSGAAYIGTVNVAANATLTEANTTLPTFGTLDPLSMLTFTGSGSYTLPNVTYGSITCSTSGVLSFATAATYTIAGSLLITTGSVQTTATGAANTTTVNISGNCTLTGGSLVGPSSTASFTANITGNLSLSNASTLNEAVAASGTFNLYVSGNLSFSGTSYSANSPSYTYIYLNNTSSSLASPQLVSNTSTSASGNYTTITVNSNCVAQLTNSFTCTGTFSQIFTVNGTLVFPAGLPLQGNGTVNINSGSTIYTANTSGLGGSITITNKSYVAGANYVFNPATSIAAPFPTTTFGNPASVTINPGSGNSVTLNINPTITGTLTMTSGKLAIGAHTLTLNGNVSGMSGANSITGSSSSNLTIGGTGTMNPIFFDQTTDGTTNLISTLTLNRTTSGTATLGNKLQIGTACALNNGQLLLNDQALVLTGTFTGSSSNNLVGSASSALTLAGTTSTGTLFFSQTTPGTTNNLATFTLNGTFTGTATLGSNLNVSSGLTISSGTLAGGANTISLQGGWTNNATATAFTAGTSTVVCNGSSSQTIGGTAGTNFNALTINNTSGVTLSAASNFASGTSLNLENGTFSNGSNLTVSAGSNIVRDNGTLGSVPTFGGAMNVSYANLGVGASVTTGNELPTGGTNLSALTINQPGQTITLGASVTTNGALTITAGTLDVSATPYNITAKGAWVNNGTLTPQTGTVTFSGGSAQTITGSSAISFYNLTLSNSSGLTINNNATVSHVLGFTSGILTVSGSNVLTVPGASGGVTGAGTSSYVVGTLAKTLPASTTINYEVGDADYAPVTLVLSATGTGTIGVKATAGNHPQISTSGIYSTANTGHYWTLSNPGGASGFSTITPTFSYQTADITGGAGNTGFQAQIYNSGWGSVISGTTNANPGGTPAYSTSSPGAIAIASYLGDYEIGKTNTPAPVLTAAAGATVDGPFVITFPDDPTWRAAFSSITVNGTPLTAGYAFGVGTLTLTPSASVPANLLQTSGAPTIAVLATGYSGTGVIQTIAAGADKKLVISVQPTAPATNGAVLATQPVVFVEDQYSNVTTSSANVTATATGAGTWTVSGTNPVAATTGTVTFTNLAATANAYLNGATITFTSGTLTATPASTAFNIPQASPYTWHSKTGTSLDLSLTSNWTSDPTGVGGGSFVSPPNFTNAGQTYMIDNGTTPTIASSWTVSGAGSNITVGNGSTAINFTNPTGALVITGTVNVTANATLTWATTSTTNEPTFGTLDPNSTVNYTGSAAFAAIPAVAYGNFIYSSSNNSTFAPGTSSMQYFTASGGGVVKPNNSGSTVVMNIAHDLNISGATFRLLGTGGTTASSTTINVGGNLNLSSGAIDLCALTTSGTTPVSIINLAGNLNITGGAISTAGTSQNGSIVFDGTSTQTLTNSVGAATTFTNFVVNSGSTLQLLNNVTLSGSATSYRQGTFTVNGILDMQGNTISGNAASAIFNLNAGGTLETSNTGGIPGSVLSGSITTTYNAGANYVFYPATSTSTPFPATFGAPANVTISTGTVTSNANFSPSVTVTVASGATLDMAGFVLGGAFTPSVSGTIKTQNTSGAPLPSGLTWGGTVNYNAASGTQTVMAGIYNNLTEGNAGGTNSASGNVTVNGSLTTTSGGTFDMATYTLNGTLTPTNNGTIRTSSSANPPIPAGKNWSGTTGTVIYALAGGGQTVAQGTYNNLTVSNTSSTDNAGGNLTVNGSLTTTSGGTLNMATYILNGTLTPTNNGSITTSSLNNPAIPTGQNWTGTTGGVTYAVTTGGQTISDGTYGNITLSNTSGTDAATGSITVNGATFTVLSGGTLDMVNGILSGTAVFTNNGTILTASTSGVPLPAGNTWGGTINYDAPAGSQTAVAGTYNNLTVSNTSGTTTAGGNLVVGGALTTSGGTLNMGSNTLSGSLTSISGTGTIKTQNTSSTPIPTGKTWTQTVEYNNAGGGQTAVTGTFAGLTNSNTSSTNTVGGAITVNGNLTLTSGSTLADAGTVIPISGNLLGSGSYTGTGGITMTGSGANIAGVTVDNLTLNNAGGFNLTGNATVTGVLTFTNGKLTTGLSNSITVPGSGGISGASSSKYVNGNLVKTITGLTSLTYEVGDVDYAPVSITLNAAGTGAIGIGAFIGNEPHLVTSSLDPVDNVSHYWIFTAPGGASGFSTISPVFTYNAGDIDGGGSTNNSTYAIQIYSGSSWGSLLPTTNTTTPYTSYPTSALPSSGYLGNYAIGKQPPVSPTLVANTTPPTEDNVATLPITFTDDPTWRGAIYKVTAQLGSGAVYTLTPTTDYAISVGTLSLIPTVADNYLTQSGTYAIVVYATGYTAASVSQLINPGVATQLAMSVQPTNVVTNGGAPGTSPVVITEDHFGNPTSSSATIAAASTAPGTWTIGGTTSVTASAGVATFSALTATSLGPVTGATIQFTSSGLTSVTSGSFNIAAPAPPSLTASGSATVDAPFAITYTDNATWRAAVTFVTAQLGGAAVYTLTPTTDYTFAAGVLTLTPTATDHYLTVSGTYNVTVHATGYTNDVVSQLINPGVGTQLVMSVQPTAPASNGGALGTQPVVLIEDQYNNITTSGASVTAAATGGLWVEGGTTPVPAVSGVATFTLTAGTASSVAFTGATITFSVGSFSVTSSAFNIPNGPLNWYSKTGTSLNLASTSNWTSDPLGGTGSAPADFTTSLQTFHIANGTTPTITGAWTVSGSGSGVIVGDGSTAINFTIPSSVALTGTVSVAANGTLTNTSTTNPTFGTFDPASSMVFNGTAAQTIPLAAYGKLTYSGSSTGTMAAGGISATALTVTAGTVNMNTATTNTVTVGSGGFTQTGGTFNVSKGAVNNVLAINGNFTLSGAGTFALNAATTTLGATVTVNGTCSVTPSGGTGINMASANAGGVSGIFQVNGDAYFGGSGFYIDFGAGTVTGAVFGLTGNLTALGTGQFYTSTFSAAGAIGIKFDGSGTSSSPQTFNYGSTSTSTYCSYLVNTGTYVKMLSSYAIGASTNPKAIFTVNGTLDLQGFVLSGGAGSAGTGFVLSTGGTIATSNTGGLVTAVTATPATYNTGANYIFYPATSTTTPFPSAITSAPPANVTVNSGTVTSNFAIAPSGVITVASGATFGMGTNQLTGSFTVANSGTIKTACISSASPVPTGVTWGTTTGTFEYDGANVTPNVMAGTYNNLNINTGVVSTASGALTVDGTLTTSSTSTLNMAANQLIGGGSFSVTNNGTISTTCTVNPPIPQNMGWSGTTGVVTYAATTGGQSISFGAYKTLKFLNTSGTNTATGDITLNGTLTTTTGTGIVDMSTYQLIGGSTPSISNAGTIQTSSTANPPLPTNMTWTGTTGAVIYALASGGQYIPHGTFKTLTLDNTSGNTNTAVGAVAVSTSLSVAGGTLDMQTNDLSGAFTPSGTGIIRTADISSTPLTASVTWPQLVEYYSAGQTIVSGTYNGGLTNSCTGSNNTIATSGVVNVAGNLTLNTGTLNDNGVVIALTGNIAGTGTHTSGGSGLGAISMNTANATVSGAAALGNITLNAAGTFTMTGSTTINGTLKFTAGNFALNGNSLTLNGAVSGTTASGNSFTGSASSNLTIANSGSLSTLYFTSSAGASLASFTMNRSATTATLGSNLSIGGNLGLSAGTVADGGNTITVAGNITGSGTHTSTSGGSITMAGGAVAQTISNATLGNVTLNNSHGFSLTASPATITGTLTMNGGSLSIGGDNLIFDVAAGPIGGTFSSANMIIANSTGIVYKNYNANGSFLFPIGDNTPNYTPFTINMTGSYSAGAKTGINVTAAKEPHNPNTTDYLKRYWTVTTSGISSPVYTVIATYVPADVTGTETNIDGGLYTGSLPWIRFAATDAVAHTFTATGATAPGNFTGVSSANATVSVAPNNSIICGGSNVTLVATGTGSPALNYAWSPATGLSATTGASVVASPTTTGTYIYTVTLTDGSGFVASNTATVTVSSNQWGGATSTSWSTSTNWTCGAVPVVSTDVVIPAPAMWTGTFAPTIGSGSLAVHALNIAAGVTLTISSGASLDLGGNLVNNGVVKGSGILSMSGASPTLTGNGVVNNLTLNNSAGATIGTSDTVGVAGVLLLNSGTLITNGRLMLVSNSSDVGGSIGTITGGHISGNVVVQQYMPGHRAYRFMAHPFSTPVALSQLQTYIDITGSGGSTNGFTPTATNAPSAFYYNPLISNSSMGSDPGWVAFSNITNNINQFEGIRIFIRGAKGEGLNTTYYTPDPVTVRMYGAVNTGNRNVSMSAGTASVSGTPTQLYNLVGNPYPSPVDIGAVISTAQGAGSIYGTAFYIWDPFGGAGTGAYIVKPISMYPSYILQANASFEVQAMYNGAILPFTESNKSALPTDQLLKSAAVPGRMMKLSVYDQSYHPWDAMYVDFNDAASDREEGLHDAGKNANPDLNFYSISSDNAKLSIDSRPYEIGKVIPLGLTSNYAQDFIIKVDEMTAPAGGGQVYLHDKYLKQYTLLNTGTEYKFSVTTDSASQGDNRFELGMQAPTVVAAVQKEMDIQMLPNPASDEVTISYNAAAKQVTTVRIMNVEGVTVLSNDLGMQQSGSIRIPLDQLASGIYIVEFTSGTDKITRRLVKE